MTRQMRAFVTSVKDAGKKTTYLAEARQAATSAVVLPMNAAGCEGQVPRRRTRCRTWVVLQLVPQECSLNFKLLAAARSLRKCSPWLQGQTGNSVLTPRPGTAQCLLRAFAELSAAVDGYESHCLKESCKHLGRPGN